MVIAGSLGLVAPGGDVLFVDWVDLGKQAVLMDIEEAVGAGGLDELWGEEVEDAVVDQFAGDVFVSRDPGTDVGVPVEEGEDVIGGPEDLGAVVIPALDAGVEEQREVGAAEEIVGGV